MQPHLSYDDHSRSGLRTALLLAAVALGIPVFVLLMVYLSGGKLAVVRNDSAEAVAVQAVVHNGIAVERTEAKAIQPHQLGWIVFFPRLRGGLTIFCKGSRMFASRAISSIADGIPVYASTAFETCNLPPHFDRPS